MQQHNMDTHSHIHAALSPIVGRYPFLFLPPFFPKRSETEHRTAAASLVYDSEGTSVDAVVLEDGRQVHANAVVSATGAWMRELMPVPMVPHKGQMMALREPAGGLGAGAPRQGGGIGLTRVFFAEGCYIIPKRDGRVVVGSTVEVSCS